MQFFYTLGLLCISLNGFAYSTSSDKSTQEAWLTHTKSWNDYAEGLRVNIPKNVVKEFETAVKELPLPTAKKLRFGIFLQNINGKKVKVTFKDNGEVFFNGTRWRFKPLTSIDSELKRLAEEITGANKRALLDVFIPKAYADTTFSEQELSLAAAAFAAGYSWRAHACMAENLGDELLADCMMMAAPIRSVTDFSALSWMGMYGNIIPASLSMRDWEEGTGFIPTSVKCPKRLPGVVEWIITNKRGDAEKISGEYKDIKTVRSLTISISKKAGSFKEYKNYPPTVDADIKTAGGRLSGVLEYVCAKETERKKYEASLKDNKDRINRNRGPGDEEDIFEPAAKGLRDAS